MSHCYYYFHTAVIIILLLTLLLLLYCLVLLYERLGFQLWFQTAPTGVKVKVAQLCPNLCDPMDYTVHGILQARMEWVAVPSPGDLPNPGIEPRSLTLQADSLPSELLGVAARNTFLSAMEPTCKLGTELS